MKDAGEMVVIYTPPTEKATTVIEKIQCDCCDCCCHTIKACNDSYVMSNEESARVGSVTFFILTILMIYVSYKAINYGRDH